MLALQALCLFDSLGDAFAPELDAFLRDTVGHADLSWSRAPRSAMISFARGLAVGAWESREQSDRLLNKHVPDWSVERMRPVDRAILRLGVYELLECPDRPFQVVINEAVELAHKFGGRETPAFVNGVLDHLRLELDAEAAPPTDSDSAPPTEPDSAPPTAPPGAESAEK